MKGRRRRTDFIRSPSVPDRPPSPPLLAANRCLSSPLTMGEACRRRQLAGRLEGHAGRRTGFRSRLLLPTRSAGGNNGRPNNHLLRRGRRKVSEKECLSDETSRNRERQDWRQKWMGWNGSVWRCMESRWRWKNIRGEARKVIRNREVRRK
jgi:hypothetical protein